MPSFLKATPPGPSPENVPPQRGYLPDLLQTPASLKRNLCHEAQEEAHLRRRLKKQLVSTARNPLLGPYGLLLRKADPYGPAYLDDKGVSL